MTLTVINIPPNSTFYHDKHSTKVVLLMVINIPPKWALLKCQTIYQTGFFNHDKHSTQVEPYTMTNVPLN